MLVNVTEHVAENSAGGGVGHYCSVLNLVEGETRDSLEEARISLTIALMERGWQVELP